MKCKYCRKDAPDAPYCCFCGKLQEARRQAHKRGNGQGTAYKRGKTWTGVRPGYQYTDDEGLHRKRQTKGGFSTKKDALEWASGSDVSMDHSQKVIDLWQLYSENDLKNLSKSKQTAYKIARRRLEPIMGMEIHQVTLNALQGLLNASGSHYKARDMKTIMSKLYKKAMASNKTLVNKNLAEFLVLPKLEESEAQPFTEDEVKAFWKLYDSGDYFVGFILLMVYTGMMPAELQACTKKMVDLEKCEIFGCGAKTKSRKNSAIVFPEFLRPVVASLFDFDGDYLLPYGHDTFYLEYYECLQRAGVRKLPPYSCRHTYGTEAVKLGLHPAIIQKLLRHSTTKMQERYTHLSSDDAHEGAKLFSRG